MKAGDACVVRNLDGETADGTIVEIHAVTVSDKEAEWWGDGERTLFEYWRGADVDPDAPVVSVLLGEHIYEYPADRVEVVDA